MNKQEKLDVLYMDIANRVSDMSYGRRLKVGAVIVKGDNLISMGWNGMPAGMDNNCETEHADGSLSTRPETLHAESNALMKLVREGGGSLGSTLYTTYSPCPECAKLIKQAGVARVVYRHNYRLLDGVEMLRKLGVPIEQLK